MKPICLYAIFAESATETDLIRAHTEVSFAVPVTSDPEILGHLDNLFIYVMADPGPHEITVTLEDSNWRMSHRFTVDSETQPTCRVQMRGQFPVVCRPTAFVNRYPILLDGEPFGEAYLVTRPVAASKQEVSQPVAG